MMRTVSKKQGSNRGSARRSPVAMAPDFSERIAPETVGYARVSTVEQSLDMQLSALEDEGCDIIFHEKVGADDLRRHQFSNLKKYIMRGDTVVVYAFSRLNRNLKKLLILVDWFEENGINLRSKSEPHIAPFTTAGRMMLSVIGALDENEVRRVRDRTRDGMAERKRRGQRMGRPLKVTPEIAAQMKAMRKRKIAAPIIATKFKLSVQSVYANT